MAELGFHFHIHLIFCLSLISSIHSRDLLNPQTTLLDVSASIHKTHHILSFNQESLQSLRQQEQEQEQEQPTFTTDPSSFSVPVHSREAIWKSQHQDYRSLTLARLKRDSARVDSLNMELDLAIRGMKKSDLKPKLKPGQQLTVANDGQLQGPIVSGTSQGSGEYFSRVGLGTPPNQQYLVLDTGSDVTWVQCAPCSECYQQSDPVFDPSSSSTFAPLSCQSQQCQDLDVSACRNGSCMYQVSYGDGSFTVGDFVSESLSFGNSGVQKVAIGCGHDNEGLFVGSAGLLGLGGGSLSFPSQVKATAFSYCLVDRDSTNGSTLTFGPLAQPSNAVTAPLVRNRQVDTFYYVLLEGMSVGGQMLPLPESMFSMDVSGNGGIIVDSGTAITRLQTDAYNSLRDAFVRGTQNLPKTDGIALFDTCYDLSSRTSVEVPTVSFHFPGGKTLPLPAKNYLIPVDSSGTFCFAFAPTSSSLSIIGNVQQQGTRVSLDLGNSLVGFTSNQC